MCSTKDMMAKDGDAESEYVVLSGKIMEDLLDEWKV